MAQRARKARKAAVSVLDQPGRVARATVHGTVGSLVGGTLGGIAGGMVGGNRGANIVAYTGMAYGGAAGARSGWNTHPNARNAKTAVRSGDPTPVRTKGRVGRK